MHLHNVCMPCMGKAKGEDAPALFLIADETHTAASAPGFLFMSTTITTVDSHVPLQLPVELTPMKLPPGLQKRDGATQVAVPGQRTHQKLDLVSAVAEHFTPEEKRAALAWLTQHPEVPVADNGPRVFPDPYTARVHRELKRNAESGKGWGLEAFTDKEFAFDPSFERTDEDDGLKEAPDEVFPDSAAANNEIHARIEAASVARNDREKADRPIERFMADADERLEPYLAFREGMSLSRIATTYGVANIRLLLDKIEQGLNQLERERPYFDRKYFLTKAKRAIEIRRRDAGVGAARAAAERAALAKPAEAESTEKRGAEWATIDHICLPRAVRHARPSRKKDEPWIGTNTARSTVNPCPQSEPTAGESAGSTAES